MNAVTGIGPRTGTSWVMQQLKAAGLEINGHKFIERLLVPEHNPDGYWELDPEDAFPTTGISKVWGIWHHPDMYRVVVLKRTDTKAHLASIERVMKDEMKLPECALVLPENWNALDIVAYYYHKTNTWLKTRDPKNTMLVSTENLNTEIKDIIRFLKEDI